VVVRLYELSQRDRFDRATFFELYDHDDTTLADSLLSRTEVIVRPGETLQVPLRLLPDTRAIAAMAAYEKVGQATWRSVVEVSPSVTQTLSVDVGPDKIAAGPERDHSRHDTFWAKTMKPLKALIGRAKPDSPTP
jgi:type VI secretion system protein VasD